MRRIFLPLAVLMLLGTVFPVGSRSENVFDFYGLRFGLNRTQVAKLMPISGEGVVKQPGHGMSSLELAFDREGLLMEIVASYNRPVNPLEMEGLKRALTEKFISPARTNFPDMAVTLDEFNRASYTLRFLSKGIREKNIEYHKDVFLMSLQ